MADHGILFSSEMVRALLARRKTRTRRMSKRWLKVKAGDTLWVREAWAPALWSEYCAPFDRYEPGSKYSGAIYAATPHPEYNCSKWKPSINIPRWASRISLIATEDARLERLQDITTLEASLEGVCDIPNCEHDDLHRDMFRKLWSTLHTKPGERWEDNPELVVIPFDYPEAR